MNLRTAGWHGLKAGERVCNHNPRCRGLGGLAGGFDRWAVVGMIGKRRRLGLLAPSRAIAIGALPTVRAFASYCQPQTAKGSVIG